MRGGIGDGRSNRRGLEFTRVRKHSGMVSEETRHIMNDCPKHDIVEKTMFAIQGEIGNMREDIRVVIERWVEESRKINESIEKIVVCLNGTLEKPGLITSIREKSTEIENLDNKIKVMFRIGWGVISSFCVGALFFIWQLISHTLTVTKAQP